MTNQIFVLKVGGCSIRLGFKGQAGILDGQPPFTDGLEPSRTLPRLDERRSKYWGYLWLLIKSNPLLIRVQLNSKKKLKSKKTPNRTTPTLAMQIVLDLVDDEYIDISTRSTEEVSRAISSLNISRFSGNLYLHSLTNWQRINRQSISTSSQSTLTPLARHCDRSISKYTIIQS